MARNAGLEYRIILRPLTEEEGGGWFAEIPELPGCFSDGETPDQALQNLQDAQNGWIETAKALGRSVPLPQTDVDKYSGKFTVRVPRALHRDLSIEAERQGVSLNHYVTYVLSERRALNAARERDEQAAVISESETTIVKNVVRRFDQSKWGYANGRPFAVIPEQPIAFDVRARLGGRCK